MAFFPAAMLKMLLCSDKNMLILLRTNMFLFKQQQLYWINGEKSTEIKVNSCIPQPVTILYHMHQCYTALEAFVYVFRWQRVISLVVVNMGALLLTCL